VGKNKVTNTREVFNKYFITVAENLEMRNANKNEAMKLLDTLKFDNFLELRLIPTMEAEIKNILMLQKSKNSTRYDGISSRILKSKNYTGYNGISSKKKKKTPWS
jgi:hypothetical protein